MNAVAPPAPAARSLPLFWRTLLLIVALMVTGLLLWWPAVRVFEREPRAHQIAQQLVSIVHATRIALIYSDPARRRDLIADMLDNESLRVVPLEPSDRIEPFRDTPLMELVQREVRERLGPTTRFASAVNGVPGFWLSFSIDDDAYWVFIERDLLRRDLGRGWIALALLAISASLLVAVATARVVNRPLAALSRAAAELGAGRAPALLPERGPVEIRTVNRSFNSMVSDLAKLEHDRAVLLAGVSHDLRTPLTRLRLELEMSALPEETRLAMAGDIDQIDAIVGQFLDFALPSQRGEAPEVDLSALLAEALVRARLARDEGGCAVAANIEPGVLVQGHATEIARALDNLLSNAQRYGREASGTLRLSVQLRRDGEQALLAIEDSGPGIPEQDIDRLLRPFERGESARSGTAGAGLGLAIVSRIARAHGARLRLASGHERGLRVEIVFPRARSAPTAQ